MGRTLIIVTGPTAVGKTEYAIGLAKKFGSPVISCDSRQIYKEMSVGTAVPDKRQLAEVRHYFIQSISVTENYSSGQYEIDALSLIEKLFGQGHQTLIMCGGSGFYIDAVRKGLDNLPVPPPELREELTRRVRDEGVASLAEELKSLDRRSWESIDITNGQRVVRALETFIVSGRSFTEFKLEKPKKRDFDIEVQCLTMPRTRLYERIDHRVVRMIEEGLVDEVRSLEKYRGLPALQTVGYKEIFSYLDGNIPLEEAIRLIQRNTRHYAKKQLTWWKRYSEVKWICADSPASSPMCMNPDESDGYSLP